MLKDKGREQGSPSFQDSTDMVVFIILNGKRGVIDTSERST